MVKVTLTSWIIDTIFLVIYLFYLPPLLSSNKGYLPFLSFGQFLNQSNLLNAINFLKLPTWSRNYKSCFSPDSEVSCAQLIHSYETISNWEKIRNNLTLEQSEPHILHIKPQAGTGNMMYHITSGIILAMALNKTVIITKQIDGIFYPKSLRFLTKKYSGCNKRAHWPIMNYENWQRKESVELGNSGAHITVTFCYPYFLLMDQYLSKFTFSNFGIHFTYYILNYAAEISNEVKDIVFQLFNAIPQKVKVIGVHLRNHKSQSPFFITSIQKVESLIVPFLNDLFSNGLYIALATDNQNYINRLNLSFPNRLIIANVERKPNGAAISAMTDICLLMMCNKMIGTFRSSFSTNAAQRTLMRPYWIAMENPNLFRFTNSQAGIVSTIMENAKHDYNYILNFRARLYPSVEYPMRVFFRNLAL
ncbi:hypothetical protein TRFO_22484 [Tritrichomonas foetus]|uniref:Uncharacterized protein n=1 Tax=Tritrichomonas foetus TaxID=1144522 RepID=A0A1J4KCF4_9EUKA|nr:hypothetical protein TRFO_22484 [Tritrichomonas foetus]|eukprot:OHT08891.1 hypothetical protein TRFO_22484 [Tritrichomonas foetus]